MTGEAVHTTLEERMVPGLLFTSECVPQLSITEIAKWFVFSYVSDRYTAIQMKNTKKRTSVTNQHNGKLEQLSLQT